MKMNKKGFTLIEMLVVIAIIAILVAIIVPTVSTSTKKAAYATDAANLRSSLAEAEILYLNNKAADGTDIAAGSAQEYDDICTWTPKGAYGGTGTPAIVISVNEAGQWTATIGSKTIAQIATGAETGTLGS